MLAMKKIFTFMLKKNKIKLMEKVYMDFIGREMIAIWVKAQQL